MKTWLVTGGTGFVGSHIVEALRAQELTVRTLARGAKPPDLEADLAAGPPSLGRRFDAVVHAAGLAHVVPKTPEEIDRFRLVNVVGTKNLLAALSHAAPPTAFVLISTVAVYGVESGQSLDEETPRNARDPYGASKREVEDLVAAWAAENSVRLAIARLPLVAGRGAPGNLGSMMKALRHHRYFGVGAGDARRSVVRAADVGSCMTALATRGGTYHLTDGRHPSFAELERALCRALGRRPPPRLPLAVAKVGGHVGDWVEAFTGRSVPFNGRVLQKMTTTLTFSEARARAAIGWSPTPVVEAMDELL